MRYENTACSTRLNLLRGRYNDLGVVYGRANKALKKVSSILPIQFQLEDI
jgi:hypothetical protein